MISAGKNKFFNGRVLEPVIAGGQLISFSEAGLDHSSPDSSPY